MNPAARTHKITIKSVSTTIDNEGVEAKTLTIVKTLWAAVEHRNSSEKWANGRMNPEITDLFETGYVSGITSDMIVTRGERTFEIIGVEDVRDEHRSMIIQAKEVIL